MSKRTFEVYAPKDGVSITDYSNARIADFEMIYTEKMNSDDGLESMLMLFNLNKSNDTRSKSLVRTDIVAVINQNGHKDTYYCDDHGYINLPDFTKDKDIDLNSTHLKIEGQAGTWRAIDREEIEGHSYFLLENEQYGDDVANVLVDSSGNVFANALREGISLAVINQVKEMMKPFNGNDPSKNYLKSIEEVDEDGSYSQIDGVLNSSPKGAKQERQSLIAKLHEYDALIHSKAIKQEELERTL